LRFLFKSSPYDLHYQGILTKEGGIFAAALWHPKLTSMVADSHLDKKEPDAEACYVASFSLTLRPSQPSSS
jgi:hypothetical protein